MTMLYHRRYGSKRLSKKPKLQNNFGMRLTVLFLCLSMLTGIFPVLALAADIEEKFSKVVSFDSISLHYADAGGQPEKEAIPNGTCIEQNRQLVLRYTYKISREQCGNIIAGVPYYLEVSPHLVLPDLESGSPLEIQTDDGLKKFGIINADGNRAWVIFDGKEDGSGTVLSEYGELENGYFYLICNRAGSPPVGELPIEGNENLYALKFEDGNQLKFGYSENEPVTDAAKVEKGGELEDKTITWEIKYTPWQNPSPDDLVTLDTPFELRDTIYTSLHSYVPGSVTVEGITVNEYGSRDDIPEDAESYVIVESLDDSSTTLTIGGTKFNAGKATQGNLATPLTIIYQTSVNEDLFLQGGSGDKKITNTVELFAGNGDGFNSKNISSSKTVAIPQPKWLKKEGKTTRNPNGGGSTTDWQITFYSNGFRFAADDLLTLHDQLPEGSILIEDSVEVDGVEAKATVGTNNDFTVSPIVVDKPSVSITYQTHIAESMYDNGTDLGNNAAWFTFQYGEQEYTTPTETTPVKSGDGSNTSGTATLVKSNTGYNAETRTIDWTVIINPHKANLKGGTFTDDLKTVGPQCSIGHTSGLEVVGDITVWIGENISTDETLVKLDYADQQITATVGNVGENKITLAYTTIVCDPCIFANNMKATLTNTISTDDMTIGSQDTVRGAKADSTVKTDVTVLTKGGPVYDYASGIMKWTVEVDAAGLPMTNVVLTDNLQEGLTFESSSLVVAPQTSHALASTDGQKLTIDLGTVTAKTTVTFETKVNPEILGFGGDKPVVVENTIHMDGDADTATFAQVSSYIKQTFTNHGLVKSSRVDNQEELIRYDVLINPYHLALPENPSLVDTLDKRLQLDTDTVLFYKADLAGTTNKDQKPNYTKSGDGQPLEITSFDPDTNSFTVQLPIDANDRNAYVLSYTADIIQKERDGYGNIVRFDGGSVLLGGSKNNSASVSGGGGGGGGGVAARKSTITVVKTDSKTKNPLAGVAFMLYQWNSEGNTRGLPYAQAKTDEQGKLSFMVKPGVFYELVEMESIPGYSNVFNIINSPDSVTKTDNGLLIKAGEAKKELTLELTNEAYTTDIVFQLVNKFGIPMSGTKVQIFKDDPAGEENPTPDMEATVSADGKVRFSGIRRGAKYYIQQPGGELMIIEVPIQVNEQPKVNLPDGTSAILTDDYQIISVMAQEQQWALTVNKVINGSTSPLAGAAIGLYADAACQTLIKTDVSAQDGIIKFSGLIKGQKYWLKEVSAPSKYNLDTMVYAADEANPVVIITNTPIDSPVNPDEPGNPDNPGNPDEPGNPDGPGSPDGPGNTDGPGSPDEPGNPDGPGSPNGPGNPDNPGSPDEPGNPDGPGNPNEPGSSDDPGNSGGSGSPGKPENSDESGIHGTPEESDIPENAGRGEDSAKDSNIPQTGDYTWLLIAGTLIAGILLAAMTLFQIWRIKRREKK